MTEAQRKKEANALDKQLDALEAAARAATPGPWVQSYDEVITKDERYYIVKAGDGTGGCTDKDAAFIAAANPTIILGLIAELRQTRAERDQLAKNLSHSVAMQIKFK